MHKTQTAWLCVGVVLLYSHSVYSKPALKELPSITYDSLIPDQVMAESEGHEGSYTVYNPFRNVFRSDSTPSSSSTFISYLTPFRVVRNVASNVMGMGRTFATTFSQEFRNQYSALQNNFKERMFTLPDMSSFSGQEFIVPAKDSSEWLEGV